MANEDATLDNEGVSQQPPNTDAANAPDAQKPEGDGEQQQQPNPSQLARDAIIAARRQQISEELQEGGGDPLPDVPEGDNAPAGEDPDDGDGADAPDDGAAPPQAQQQGQQQGQPQPKVMEPDDDTLVPIIINGQKEMRPYGDVKRGLQMVAAGQKGLQELNNYRAELVNYAKSIGHPSVAGAKPQAQAEDPPPSGDGQGAQQRQPAAGGDDGLDYKAIAAKFQYGSEDEAAEAVKNLVETVRKANPANAADPELEKKVYARVRNQLDHEQAVANVTAKYVNIFADPVLTQFAISRVQAIYADDAQKGIYRPRVVVYEEACKTVAEKLKAPAQQGNTGLNVQQRTQRKQTAPAPIRSAGGRAPLPDGEPPAQSRSQVVANMRRARGKE